VGAASWWRIAQTAVDARRGTDQQNGASRQNLVIDRDTASRLGSLPQAIDDTLYDAFGQLHALSLECEVDHHDGVLLHDANLEE